MNGIVKSFAVLAVLAVPVSAAAQKAAPTFTKDIASIFQNKCEA